MFTGTDNATFSGSDASDTDIRALVIDKGNSPASTVELSFSSNFTVQGGNTDVAGFLTLTNGTFKISGTFPMTNRVFITPASIIPATAGIWLNNPNFTVAGTASGMSTANNGLFRVTQGTYNIGLGADDEMGGGGGSTVFIVEGGLVNVSGRFDPQGPVSYIQTGGAFHVATVGNTRPFYGSFEIYNPSSSFTMTGGSITLHNPNTGSTPVDYDVLASTVNIDDTLLPMLILGDSGTPVGTSFHVQGTTPNLQVNTGMTLVVTTNASPGFPLYMRGSSVLNNGAIIASGAGARFDFAGTTAMSYSGVGTFGSAAVPFGGDGISSNSASPITVLSPIVCNRVNLFQGGFVQSNNITLGTGGASATTVQTGQPGGTTAGGSFDIAPVHDQGTGGETVLYMQESTARTTGLELNPTRTLTSMTADNTNNLTIAGGDLTLASGGAALNLANGRVITGANTLVISSSSATVAHTHGYVDGILKKTYAGPGNKIFEVGTANGFSPVVANVTAASFPANVTATAIQGPLPNIATPATALQRYWVLGATGVTANITFNYLDPIDIPPTATETRFAIYKYDGVLSVPGGEVNTVENLAITPSVNAAGSWTLAERTTTVTSANDSGPGSLRQVVIDALPGDVISFNLGNGRRTIALASEIVIDKDLTINGSTTSPTTLSGEAITRVFNVAFGKVVSLGSLTIADGSAADNGGAVWNNGDLSLRNCTFTNNNATGNGGAVRNDGTLKVQNSTFSDNHSGSGDGGAIFNSTGQSLTLGNVTMVKNSAAGNGGGIASAGTLNVKNSIVALNNAGTAGNNIFVSAGFATSGGYNLSNDDGGGFLVATGDQVNTDPLLGPLKDNGGPTPTHAPLTISPAIDRGKDLGFDGNPTGQDQRGSLRAVTYNDPSITPPPGGDRSDIGAVELLPGVLPVSAESVKSHGATAFSIPLPLSGPVGIECRSGGATNDYQVVVTFASPVSFSSADITSGTGSVSTAGNVGNQVMANLTGVTNAQTITLALFDVNDGVNSGDVGIRMSVLVGDSTGNGSVNASDVSQVKARSGQPVDATNFRSDVTANGFINASDVSAVKARSGTSLP